MLCGNVFPQRMRVLIVARCKNGHFAPFITEQVEALRKRGVECQFFPVTKKGLFGYLGHLPALRRVLREWKPDVVHAHYGLCGLLANLQRRVPVVTTYHGSDINLPKVFVLSKIAIWLSAFNIFVSQKNLDEASPKRRFALIPCGVNLDDYPLMDKAEARLKMGLGQDQKYVLFAGAFDNTIKNAPLAQAAVGRLDDVELIELKGYSRQQVATLMQAVDTLLMTSFTEGSPQVVKEAMACGCPIVSVDVGDVKEITDGVDGCFIVDRDEHSIASALQKALELNQRTSGRDRIIERGLTNDRIAAHIADIYQSL